MAGPRAEARAALLDYARLLIASDPVCVGVEAAIVAALNSPPTLAELVAEAEQLLPASATAFERGVMIGAALTLALTPGE